jgi:hypothetical protein
MWIPANAFQKLSLEKSKGYNKYFMSKKCSEKRNHKAIYDQNWKELQDEHQREKNKDSIPLSDIIQEKTRGEGEGWISKFPPDLLNYFQSIRNAVRYNSSLARCSLVMKLMQKYYHCRTTRSGRRKGGLIFFPPQINNVSTWRQAAHCTLFIWQLESESGFQKV